MRYVKLDSLIEKASNVTRSVTSYADSVMLNSIVFILCLKSENISGLV